MISLRGSSVGFTLIELLITLVIAAIVITVGVPSFRDFIANQRVRTTASDLMADMALARAEAIKESRFAVMEPVGESWKEGWRIWVDVDGDGSRDDDEVRKVSGPVPGTARLCGSRAELDNPIVFRPDGRAAHAKAGASSITRQTIAALEDNDGIKVSDDTDPSNLRIRLVYIGVSGRAKVEIQDTNSRAPGTPCS